MPNLHLQVILPGNRDSSGLLHVREAKSGKSLALFDALGRGNAGGGDTQMFEDGNTPTGEYQVTRVESTANLNQSSYGPNGALRLEPIGGNARASGRSGILVHGGDPVTETSRSASFRPIGGLRPTKGCIRLSNSDMKQLVDVLSSASENAAEMRSEDISVTLSVDEVPACIGNGGS